MEGPHRLHRPAGVTMSRRATLSPDIVPVLSTGRHRSPRKGACFMEMASYLAGERWSDHPKCTHPLLAGLARQINDTVPDSVRARLAPMIPSVIGLTSEDVRVDATLALHCACARPVDSMTPASRAALDQVPAAEQWARDFRADLPLTTRAFRRQTAPHLVALSVEGISEACTDDPNGVLVDLLGECIAMTAELTGAQSAPPVQVSWAESVERPVESPVAAES